MKFLNWFRSGNPETAAYETLTSKDDTSARRMSIRHLSHQSEVSRKSGRHSIRKSRLSSIHCEFLSDTEVENLLRIPDPFPLDVVDVASPQDLLPDIAEVMRKIANTNLEILTLHEKRTIPVAERVYRTDQKESDVESQAAELEDPKILELEAIVACITRELMLMVNPRSRIERFRMFRRCFFGKSQLIQTLEALDQMTAISRIHGSAAHKMLITERHCYLRSCLALQGDEDVHNSVLYKLLQLLFLIVFVCGPDLPFKAMMSKPQAWVKGRIFVRDDDPRKGLLMIPGQLDDGVLPLHPEWFAHDVPLFSTPEFDNLMAEMIEITKTNPDAAMHKMSAYRTLLSRLRGALKSYLDTVTTVQTKLVGILAAVAASVASWAARSHIQAVLQSESPRLFPWNMTDMN